MKKLLYILMLAALSMSALFSAEAEKVSDKPARKAPDWLMKSIICQVPLRSFIVLLVGLDVLFDQISQFDILVKKYM